MDAYAYFGALESGKFDPPATKCWGCGEPWDGYGSDAEGRDLCVDCWDGPERGSPEWLADTHSKTAGERIRAAVESVRRLSGEDRKVFRACLRRYDKRLPNPLGPLRRSVEDHRERLLPLLRKNAGEV